MRTHYPRLLQSLQRPQQLLLLLTANLHTHPSMTTQRYPSSAVSLAFGTETAVFAHATETDPIHFTAKTSNYL
jgi:hypothetical protein